ESQERMLMVLKPGKEHIAERIFKKWGLDVAVIGRTTETGHLVMKHHGEVVGDIPLNALADNSPVYERPFTRPLPPEALTAAQSQIDDTPSEILIKLMSSPDLCSKQWITQQYDRSVMADSIESPGADAALVRVHGTNKALAITTDCTPRYCQADAYEG